MNALRTELQALAGGHAYFLSHSEISWSSVSFAGTRHSIDMAFEDTEAAEHFIAFLPEHEFTIPGQFIADAHITSVDHRIGPNERTSISIQLLGLNS